MLYGKHLCLKGVRKLAEEDPRPPAAVIDEIKRWEGQGR
jgi:hypothetical protein